MEKTIITTKDGSHSVAIPSLNVTYHSVHGAIQESVHVFIEAGFKVSDASRASDTIRIFEMGLGTGLNALLTLAEAEKLQRRVHYTAVELFPLDKEEILALNYCLQLNRPDLQAVFEQLHACDWEKDVVINPYFTIHKIKNCLTNISDTGLSHSINLVYFDAFAPLAQPGLWTKDVFEKMHTLMAQDGILVTYCSKGDVRRAMQAAGFKVEKITGPPGKREMIRATQGPL